MTERERIAGDIRAFLESGGEVMRFRQGDSGDSRAARLAHYRRIGKVVRPRKNPFLEVL